MRDPDRFANTTADLVPVLEKLRALEPIFHTAGFGLTIADFAKRMAPDYWEVGASGRRYSREFILEHLARNPPVDAQQAGWHTYGCALRRLGPDTYLLTYTLEQGGRTTRRTTLWRAAGGDWIIEFHQGTIVSREEDDVLPTTGP